MLFSKKGLLNGPTSCILAYCRAEYIQASLRAYSSTPRGSDYGYYWYLIPYRGRRSFWAIGFGGQLIVCFPDLDLIFVMTARPDEDKPPAHTKIMEEAFGPLVFQLPQAESR